MDRGGAEGGRGVKRARNRREYGGHVHATKAGRLGEAKRSTKATVGVGGRGQ